MRRGGIVPIDPDPTSSPLIPTVMCPRLLIRFQTSNTVSSTALYPQRPRYNRREGVLIVPRAAVAASLGTKPKRGGSSSNISGPSSIRGRRPSARKDRRRAPPPPRHGDQDRSSHQVDSSRTVDAARSEALADEQQRSDISSLSALRQLDRE